MNYTRRGDFPYHLLLAGEAPQDATQTNRLRHCSFRLVMPVTLLIDNWKYYSRVKKRRKDPAQASYLSREIMEPGPSQSCAPTPPDGDAPPNHLCKPEAQ